MKEKTRITLRKISEYFKNLLYLWLFFFIFGLIIVFFNVNVFGLYYPILKLDIMILLQIALVAIYPFLSPIFYVMVLYILLLTFKYRKQRDYKIVIQNPSLLSKITNVLEIIIEIIIIIVIILIIIK